MGEGINLMAFNTITVLTEDHGQTYIFVVDGRVIDPLEDAPNRLSINVSALYNVDFPSLCSVLQGSLTPQMKTALRLGPPTVVNPLVLPSGLMIPSGMRPMEDTERVKTRAFRCTDCCGETTLAISDIGLNADERVDLSCGCRVRLARIRERAKAGKVI